MMARVNYDQPPGYPALPSSLSVLPLYVSPLLPCPSVGICLLSVSAFSSPVRPCRCSAERHSLAITHLCVIQLLVMARPVAGCIPGRLIDRQRIYRPRHDAALWNLSIDDRPAAVRTYRRRGTTARRPPTPIILRHAAVVTSCSLAI